MQRRSKQARTSESKSLAAPASSCGGVRQRSGEAAGARFGGQGALQELAEAAVPSPHVWCGCSLPCSPEALQAHPCPAERPACQCGSDLAGPPSEAPIVEEGKGELGPLPRSSRRSCLQSRVQGQGKEQGAKRVALLNSSFRDKGKWWKRSRE